MLSAEWKQLSWSLPVIAHKHGVRAQVQKKAMVAKITVQWDIQVDSLKLIK